MSSTVTFCPSPALRSGSKAGSQPRPQLARLRSERPRGGDFRQMNRLVPPKHPKADARFIKREPADTGVDVQSYSQRKKSKLSQLWKTSPVWNSHEV
jgi:hypothetical protein